MSQHRQHLVHIDSLRYFHGIQITSQKHPKYTSFGTWLNHIYAEWRVYASVNKAMSGSNNGLSPVRKEAIVWTSPGLLSNLLFVGPLETNVSEIVIGIQIFSRNKIDLTRLQYGGHFVFASMF